ncbi:hypothetical protein PG994_012482, partial [Apiospora phragmitis]
ITLPHHDGHEVERSQSQLLSLTSQLQTLLTTPNDLIRRLATHSQLLACLHWLIEFQVLACIPLRGSVAAQDVANLVGVPEGQLLRIVRMTATAGFLREAQPGFVAHTSLSEPFVSKLVHLDALMFLAQTAAPAASMMNAATKRHGKEEGTASALTLALNTRETFQMLRESRPKLQRQWLAHLACEIDNDDECVIELLSQLDWKKLQNVTIVDVASTSMTLGLSLANRYPSAHLILQTREPLLLGHQDQASSVWNNSNNGAVEPDPSSRISMQSRAAGAPQVITSAVAYILNLESCSSQAGARDWLLTELKAHLAALRNSGSALILAGPRLIPEAGSVHPDIEATARVRDLLLLQLANEQELGVAEITGLIESVKDNQGGLVTVHTEQQFDGRIVALMVKYARKS